ncbi:MAG: hypothetical protein ACJATN_001498 [Neolewinella sp.]|jgi:predicted lipoprotein
MPDWVETPFADFSINCIQENFTGWTLAYAGGTGAEAYGFEDYLAELGNTTLAPRIQAAIADIDTHLEELTQASDFVALSDLVVNRPATVARLADEFRVLLVLVQVDLASALGVTITFDEGGGEGD